MYSITVEEARRLGDALGAKWSSYDIEQFRLGMEIEQEHGTKNPELDVTHDDPITTAKIVLAHLNQVPDYYSRLVHMEKEANAFFKRVKTSKLHNIPYSGTHETYQ